MGEVRGRHFPDITFGAVIEGVGWVDHAWLEAGLPTCHWNTAPAGLATRRQLRELGLCPGGYDPVAALRRRPGGFLHAWLYRLDLAAEKRTATPAVLAALGEAMRARRTCRSCGRDTGCCIPTSLGECWECYLSAPTRAAAQHDPDSAGAVAAWHPPTGDEPAGHPGRAGNQGDGDEGVGGMGSNDNDRMECPDCRGSGCRTCDRDGAVPRWLADPTVVGQDTARSWGWRGRRD